MINNPIKIVSGGLGSNTKIYNMDGRPIEGITRIDISITPDGFTTAILKFEYVELEILADWNNQPLKKWANKKTGKK